MVTATELMQERLAVARAKVKQLKAKAEAKAKLESIRAKVVARVPRPPRKVEAKGMKEFFLREAPKTPVTPEKIKYVEVVKARPERLTPQQYFQEVTEMKREAGKIYSGFQTMVEDIKPTTFYKYKGTVFPGFLLKPKIEKEYKPRFREQEQQLQMAWVQARDLPKGTIITKTPKGYEFKLSDKSLAWSKKEFAKIERLKAEARKHTERQFADPLAGITGAVQHVGAGVAEFGFGAVSSIGALIKPIVLDPLIGTPESRRKHFVSPLDVAFEPLGWSPKGSTELMKGKPLFVAGGVAGEVLQAYGFTQLMKPVSAGVKIGAKGFVKRVPIVYAKFAKVFPEEKLIAKFGGKLATKEIPKTTYRWAAKGYQKGLQLTSAGVKTSKKLTKKLGSELQKISQRTTFGRGAVKRVWLSPAEFAKAEKDIASKLALKKTLERSYQARIRGGIGTAEELIEKTRYGLSPTGRRLTKKYVSIREIWKVGDEFGLAKKYKVGRIGRIERYALEGADVPLKESEALGMIVRSKTGEFLGYKQPVLYQKYLPKKWISKYRTPFLKNIEAQMSATVQKFKFKVPKPSLIGGKRGLTTELTKTVVPSSLYKPLYKTGLELGLLGLVKTVPISKRKYGLKPITIADQFKQQVPALKMGDISLLDAFTGQKVVQVQKPVFEPIKDVTQVSLVESAFDFDIIPKPKQMKVSTFKMIGPTVPVIPLLPKILYGRGRRRFEYDLFGKERKFRKRDIFDPLKLDIKINLKGL